VFQAISSTPLPSAWAPVIRPIGQGPVVFFIRGSGSDPSLTRISHHSAQAEGSCGEGWERGFSPLAMGWVPSELEPTTTLVVAKNPRALSTAEKNALAKLRQGC
jgi:hypothetical protein